MPKMLRNAVIIVLFAAVNGKSFSDGRIVGGKEVDISNFPYQVSLRFNGVHFCGASIIGPRHILTAAHCAYGRMANQLSVRVGSTSKNLGGQIAPVVRATIHPNYNTQTYDNDMAILELFDNLVLGDKVRPIQLANDGESILDGTFATVSGWGSLAPGGQSPTNLNAVQVPIVNHKVCEDAYSPRALTDKMFCAGYLGEGGKDSCQGDSGGPLVNNNKLIGVVSWGIGCADAKYPGVYANVAALRKFIRDNSGI